VSRARGSDGLGKTRVPTVHEGRRDGGQQPFQKARPAQRQPQARRRDVSEAREGEGEHLAVRLRPPVPVAFGPDLRELAAAPDTGLLVPHDVAPVEQGYGLRKRAEARRDYPRGHGREVSPERKRIPLPVEEPVHARVALGGHARIGIREIENGQDDFAQAGLLEPPYDGVLGLAAALGRVEEECLDPARQVRIRAVRVHAKISGSARRGPSAEEKAGRERDGRRSRRSRGAVLLPVNSVAWPAA